MIDTDQVLEWATLADNHATDYSGSTDQSDADWLRERDMHFARLVHNSALEMAAAKFEATVDTWSALNSKGYAGAVRRQGAAAIRSLKEPTDE